ncbi:MAG TPA: type I-E CRISPR-associated endoribonuclease Cas2, partial [Candidatus Limivicinus faecipullorum]|nr:type I-E CRISPR-associated endoribonuclease Cas2 [Candidatus Limivicinus faecipullorum]
MVVIVLTDCPPKLRGDLSKWLFEINTGVYVGRVSARVRELLWERICENLNKGQATMVYPAAVEQRMEFRVHNTSWTIADYDGLKLMRRPLPMPEGERDNGILEAGFSKAAAYRKINRMQRSG